MDVKTIIEKEKLDNILNPARANREFKITVRFKKFSSDKFEQACELAKKNSFYLEEGEGESKRFYASFLPDNVQGLFELFELVKNRETTTIFINNKQIPYIQDLWLFLMWFHLVE